jgi:hypothetical protein
MAMYLIHALSDSESAGKKMVAWAKAKGIRPEPNDDWCVLYGCASLMIDGAVVLVKQNDRDENAVDILAPIAPDEVVNHKIHSDKEPKPIVVSKNASRDELAAAMRAASASIRRVYMESGLNILGKDLGN